MAATPLRVRLDEQAIDGIFAGLNQCELPGAAVGIAIGGKPVYRRGFGLASLELPVCLTPSTRIRIGSSSKLFTALACMLLCEDGQARLDDSIGKYVPELHPVAQPVTLRQLLGNTSGVRDALGIISQFSGHRNARPLGKPTSTREVLALYAGIDDVDTPSGTAFTYNNGGFVLLSVVIERIAGQSLEQFMRERIFEPLGMHDSLVRRWDTDFIPNCATCHHFGAAGRFERAYFGYDYAGGGAVVSTVNDMLRWMQNVFTHEVGSAATWDTIRTSQQLSNGMSSGYGLGMFVGRYRGLDTLHHPGGWIGSQTQMLMVPAANLSIVVMANRNDVSALLLANQVLDACIPSLDATTQAVKVPVANGTFRSPSTGRVVQLLAKEGQQTVSINGLDLPVEAGAGRLRIAGAYGFVLNMAVTLLGDPTNPAGLHLDDHGNVDELARVAPVERPYARGIAGRYRSDSTGIEASIAASSEVDEAAQMVTVSRFGSMTHRLECLTQNVWRATPMDYVDGVLTFDSAAAGFRFSSNHIRSLRFRRLD